MLKAEIFSCSGSLRQYDGNKIHANILQQQSAELGSSKIGSLQQHLAVLQWQCAVYCGSPAVLGGCDTTAISHCSGSLAAIQLVFSSNVAALKLPSQTLASLNPRIDCI
jgi:hypothetical protein